MNKALILLGILALATTALAKDPLKAPLAPYPCDIRAIESEPNDTCAEANALTAGDPMSGSIYAGDQDWFAVEVQAGDCWIFETHPGDAYGDTKLYIYADDCVTELAYDDDGGEGYYSMVQYDFDDAGTYYVVVTGYSGSTVIDEYILTMEGCPEPMENDTCEGAYDLQEMGLLEFDVDLCLYVNDYSPGTYGASCTGWSANGSDAVYKIYLNQGDNFSACEDGSCDLSIYLITDCADPEGSCVVGDDSGNPECISYTADASGWYYLIVDAYSSCCEVAVTVDFPTAAEDTSWGQVKTAY